MGDLSAIGTGGLYRSDLYGLFDVVQNTQVSFPKELVIGILREFFSQDSYYHYVRDAWGFPLTPDHTDLPPDAGLHDDTTTRLYIGEAYRFDVIYYPAIVVRAGSSTYVPVSMNREKETVLNKATVVVDGYGNEKIFVQPTHFILAGAWEGQLQIDIMTRSIRARDDLVELVMLACTDLFFEEFRRSGVLMKRVSAGGPTEMDDRNDKLYKQSVTLDIRSEWRRQIPITNLVDAINICVEFGNVQVIPAQTAPNLEIKTTVDLVSEIQSL
jgi:hypothetical protein